MDRVTEEAMSKAQDHARQDDTGYYDESMVNRQLLLWAIATRRQLERWEPLLAARLTTENNGPSFRDELIWQAEIERHLLLIAARNLIHAIDMAGGEIAIEQTIRYELIEGRDLNEHWRENLPIFRVTPRREEPRFPSGKRFAKRNPERSPYSWLEWNSKDGPKVLPNVPARAIHELIDRVEATVIESDSELKRFIPIRQPSPWLGEEAGGDRWWPRPPDSTLNEPGSNA
jgi:hypothetical protein